MALYERQGIHVQLRREHSLSGEGGYKPHTERGGERFLQSECPRPTLFQRRSLGGARTVCTRGGVRTSARGNRKGIDQPGHTRFLDNVLVRGKQVKMGIGIFTDKSHPPTMKQILDALGDQRSAWEEFVTLVHTENIPNRGMEVLRKELRLGITISEKRQGIAIALSHAREFHRSSDLE